ncbi:C2 domain [Dillenia turbinata]|uniref:C2 domain n=1 Tax=Dillenia turbinata TaxID=194707 RepID=A0AAN8ZF23_9MAGN
MDHRKFEMKVISACEVVNVRKLFDMKVYAVIQVAGKPATKKQTAVDCEGRTNPKWNFSLTYWLLESHIRNNDGAKLEIDLYCQRTLGDRLIGIPFNMAAGGLRFAKNVFGEHLPFGEAGVFDLDGDDGGDDDGDDGGDGDDGNDTEFEAYDDDAT